jgi:hypothetical protein
MSEPPNEKEPVVDTTANETVSEPSKTKKPYKWTPAREKAFERMRQSLSEKNELTKKIKKEKQKAEKDEIKRRVHEIMSTSKKSVDQNMSQSESSDQSESSSESERDTRPVRKEKKMKTKKKEKVEKKTHTSKKRTKKEASSSESSVEESSQSESEEERPDRYAATKTAVHNYRQRKLEKGKAPKTSAVVNPLDRFILL